MNDLDFSSLEISLWTSEIVDNNKGLVLLLERMSARPGPLADRALKLARMRLWDCAHLFDRDTYSVEARSEVFKLIAMEQTQDTPVPYNEYRTINQDSWCPVLLRLAPLVSEDALSDVFNLLIAKTYSTRDPFSSLMLELVPMVTEVVYQNMLWDLACHRRVFDMNYNESLLKTLLERRGATTVLVRIAEAALDSELSFSERNELLTSLHALLECAGGAVAAAVG
jgi:hypothetical protein